MSQLFFLATILFPNIGLGLSSSLWKQFLLVALEAWGSICVSMYWLSEVRQCIHVVLTNTGVFGLQESPLGKHVSQFDGITPAYSPVVEPVGNTSFLLAVAFSEMGFWAAW